MPITSIAVSTGQNDSGVFELNFRDERYIPFEGAGAISKWSLTLPNKFREYDYDSIVEVGISLRYTAFGGGVKFRNAAEGYLEDYVKGIEDLSREEGLFAFCDIPYDFSGAWYKANQPPDGATERLVVLDNLLDRLPTYTKRTPKNKILATDVYVFTSAALPSGSLSLLQGADETPLNDGPAVGSMKSFNTKDQTMPMTEWTLKIADTKTTVDKLYLIVRYTLGSLG